MSSLSNIPSGELFVILLYLPLTELKKLCREAYKNKHEIITNICNSELFWETKFQENFVAETKKYKHEEESWRNFYLIIHKLFIEYYLLIK